MVPGVYTIPWYSMYYTLCQSSIWSDTLGHTPCTWPFPACVPKAAPLQNTYLQIPLFWLSFYYTFSGGGAPFHIVFILEGRFGVGGQIPLDSGDTLYLPVSRSQV